MTVSFLLFLFEDVQAVEGALKKCFVPSLECRHFSCNQVVCGLHKISSSFSKVVWGPRVQELLCGKVMLFQKVPFFWS